MYVFPSFSITNETVSELHNPFNLFIKVKMSKFTWAEYVDRMREDGKKQIKEPIGRPR